jgi:C1A family cysteine protease
MKYGWKKDIEDARDKIFKYRAAGPLPAFVDLRKPELPIFNQGELGSCTAQSTATAMTADLLNQKHEYVTLSRLMIYYNGRMLEGTIDEDSGCQIRNVIKGVGKYGACPEPDWPYDISKFTFKPPDNCYTEGLEEVALVYERIPQNLTAMKTCLAGGHGFVFGFLIYPSFETQEVARTGKVRLPPFWELWGAALGGHAVYCCGYNNATKTFIVQNSWGPEWGDKGFFYMPYAYLTNYALSADFWKISLVGAKQ